MKISIATLVVLCTTALYAQTLDPAVTPGLSRSAVQETGRQVIRFDIECSFAAAPSAVEVPATKDPTNWTVRDMAGTTYPVTQVLTTLDQKERKLRGDWDPFDDLSVAFMGGQSRTVDGEAARASTTHWGFGKGKATDLNARRLMSEKARYAFDYDLKVSAVKLSLPLLNSLWLRSGSLQLHSAGTIAGDDATRNGTHTSFGLGFDPYYFVGGLMYNASVGIGYNIETTVDAGQDELLEISNKALKLDLKAEVPFTNLPFHWLHSRTGFVRAAMPLTLNLALLPEGEDGNGIETLGRKDVSATYEMAFSPYLIVKGKLARSSIDKAPAGIKDAHTYYELTFAQSLDVLAGNLWVLRLLGLDPANAAGQNFIFYRISSGRLAPNFQDIDEKSIGFGVFF